MGKTLTVQAGDTLLSIAHGEGIFDWQRIWNHPQNRELREKRSNPQVLYPGDQIHVPDKSEFFKQLEVALDQTHAFRKKTPACFFSIYLKDEGGQPYAGHRYRLRLGSATFDGSTSTDGLVCHPVPPNIQAGELTLWRDPADASDTVTWMLQIGHLNPVDTVSGVKARLGNLGYQVGPMNEELDPVTRDALENFQRHMGHDPATGEIDHRTRQDLFSLHNQH